MGPHALPPVKATQLKKKVFDACNYCIKNEALVSADLFEKSKRQLTEHETTLKEDVANKEKNKASQEKLQQQMKDYQRGMGAIPLGARGTVGGGRLQHSTNTCLGQLATFLHAFNACSGLPPPMLPA